MDPSEARSPHESAEGFRDATPADLPAIVRLLADDVLGRTREDATSDEHPGYRRAFAEIMKDPRHTILVAEEGGAIVATLQLSFLPNLTYEGGLRAQIEGVRVAESVRSGGFGRALVDFAIERAREEGCRLVQLTTDRRRPEALRFYEAAGFVASHVGLKLHLTPPAP